MSRKLIKISGWIIGAMLWLGCDKHVEPETRSFYMGFTPFPYEISAEGVNYVYDKLNSDADIINHHFDNGVPWTEALSGAEFSQAIKDDWNYRKSKTSPNHKIYLSVTPLDFTRTGLAAFRGASDNMPLPSPWNSYRFSDENVKTAFLNYCKRSIDFFKPDYFNMAIEANLLYVNKPDLWSDYLQLHTFIYHELKLAYPELPIFASVSGAPLLKGFLEGVDHVQQRLAVLQLMEYSDMYAISFYPYLSNYLGNPYPENTFDDLFHVSEKPLAVAETGYAAQGFSINAGKGLVTVESNPVKQQKYTQDLLEACSRRKAAFVINFCLRDYDQLWAQLGSPMDINIAWRDSGLYDENGNARMALTTWKNYIGKKYQH
jgi:hypothetical protein